MFTLESSVPYYDAFVSWPLHVETLIWDDMSTGALLWLLLLSLQFTSVTPVVYVDLVVYEHIYFAAVPTNCVPDGDTSFIVIKPLQN